MVELLRFEKVMSKQNEVLCRVVYGTKATGIFRHKQADAIATYIVPGVEGDEAVAKYMEENKGDIGTKDNDHTVAKVRLPEPRLWTDAQGHVWMLPYTWAVVNNNDIVVADQALTRYEPKDAEDTIVTGDKKQHA
jgi:hypothetical protein